MSMLHVVQAISSTDLSFGAVLDCTDLSLDGLVSLSQCCRWRCCLRLGFSSHTISVGMCVPTVFDVFDAKFLVALHCHHLMICGQHVVRECSFCVTMSLPAMNIQSVATFDTPPGLDSWCGAFFALGTHAVSAPNGGFVNSCCATPTSLGNTGTFPGLGGILNAVAIEFVEYRFTRAAEPYCLCRTLIQLISQISGVQYPLA